MGATSLTAALARTIRAPVRRKRAIPCRLNEYPFVVRDPDIRTGDPKSAHTFAQPGLSGRELEVDHGMAAKLCMDVRSDGCLGGRRGLRKCGRVGRGRRRRG